MKLWHIFLHSTLGLSESTAWLLTIFCLVITVRSIILPFTWKQFKSSRRNFNLRPELARLSQEYELNTDPDREKEQRQRRKELYKEHNFSPLGGCVPALIQVPFFIGLYQVMLRMARPEGGFEATTHNPIGFLSSADVTSFLMVRVKDVPMPAYVSMSEQQFALLNTSYESVYKFILPLALCASIFTSVNMLASFIRSYLTLDMNSEVGIRVQKTMLPFMVFAGIFPVLYGLTGPFPVAIVLYWFANNLWTLAQTNTIMAILHYTMPLSEDFFIHRHEGRMKRKERLSIKRARRWGVKGRRIASLVTMGDTAQRLRTSAEEWEERIAAYDAHLAERKQEREEARKQLQEARRIQREQEREKKKQEDKKKKVDKQVKETTHNDEDEQGPLNTEKAPQCDEQEPQEPHSTEKESHTTEQESADTQQASKEN